MSSLRSPRLRAFALLVMTGCWSLTASFDDVDVDGGVAGDASAGTDSGAVVDGGVDAAPSLATDGAIADESSGHRAIYLVGTGGLLRGSNDNKTPTDRTLFAPILADGTVGPWSTGPSLPTPRERMGVLGIGDTAHVVGGYISAVPSASVVSTQLLDDGGFASFTSSSSLIEPTSDSSPVVAGSRVYLVSPGHEKVLSATIAGRGFGAWRAQAGLDGGDISYYGATAIVGDRLFSFGFDRKAVVTTIGADGNVSGWRPLPPMPTRFDGTTGAAVTHGRFVYLLGGHSGDQNSGTNDVYVAEVGPDGELGSWRATEPFPGVRYRFSVAAHDDFLYVLGGELSTQDVTEVSVTRMLADGTLEPWRKAGQLPEVHLGAGYAVVTR